MIKCEFGKGIIIQGPEEVIMTELSFIVEAVRGVLTKKAGAEEAEMRLRYVFNELSKVEATEEDEECIRDFLEEYFWGGSRCMMAA